jgi:asparagine synthase (glutamine-hydrolysing)
MKAILLDPSVSRRLDLDALNLCLAFRHTPSPWTLFKNIRKIPPGSYLTFDRSGARGGTYWNDVPTIDRVKSEKEWIAELSNVYEEAVGRQMVSDVPIGLSLSSGVDSNTLLALMSRNGSRVHTFTVGFEGGDVRDDEVEGAQRMAGKFGADSETQKITEEDYANFMESYLWHLEEPIGNESGAAYHFVARLARPSVKVLMSGQGADEPFAGYWRHRAARYGPYASWVPRAATSFAGATLVPLLGRSESPGRLVDYLSQRDQSNQLLSMYSITTPVTRSLLLNDDARSSVDAEGPREYIRGWLDRSPSGTLLERMLYIDARTSLPDNLLLCGDKMAMAAGVEMRVPFLDVELMRVAERIPGKMKVSWFRNKAIHKRVCERWLPRELIHARKIGFNNPMDRWLTRKLDPLFDELTASADSLSKTVLNPGKVNAIRSQHKSGRHDHSRLLFLLLSMEMWNKVFAR